MITTFQSKTTDRLDRLLVIEHVAETRNRAQQMIEKGFIWVNGVVCTKNGCWVKAGTAIEIRKSLPFVSRAGEKLTEGLDQFNIIVTDRIALDVGASTGGFTDCLLQRGVKKVYAVDVGQDQLHPTLKNNSRVISLEKTDIRTLTKLPEQVQLVVIDVSFISLTLILPHVPRFLTSSADIITLIKPQFEVGAEHLSKRGIVRSEKLRQRAIDSVLKTAEEIPLHIQNLIPSPIQGGDGNIEYLAHFVSD